MSEKSEEEFNSFFLPEPPTFPQSLWERCAEEQDFRPILYELYKYVGGLTIQCALIHPSSPDLRPVPPSHFALLTGLLNRCCRLMLATIKLTDDGLFAETARILDRCITESALKIIWLCGRNNPEDFQHYIASGLKPKVELRQVINRTIQERATKDPQKIEERMLEKSSRLLKAARMTEDDVLSYKRFPNFEQICREIAKSDNLYFAIQKVGSHPIHGSWPDLMTFYLEWEENSGFHLGRVHTKACA